MSWKLFLLGFPIAAATAPFEHRIAAVIALVTALLVFLGVVFSSTSDSRRW